VVRAFADKGLVQFQQLALITSRL